MSFKSMTSDEIMSITQVLIKCEDVLEYFRLLVDWAREQDPYDEDTQEEVDEIIKTMPKEIEGVCEPLQMEIFKRLGIDNK